MIIFLTKYRKLKKRFSLKLNFHLFAFFLSIIPLPFLAQEIYPENLPNILPERYHIELNMDSVNYYSNHKREAKTNRDNSLLYINQFTKKDIFESGTIAYNYDSIETYLNQIIRKITSKEFIEKYNIYVYPSLETELNAYALYDGTILFNIHNFIYLNNEAEVAYILAHEIGHLIQDYNADDEWLNYMNSYDMFNGKKRKYERASQNTEIDADYKAAIMLMASGYNNEAGVSVDSLFLKLEQNSKQYVNYSRSRYLKTHPPSLERLDSAKSWISSNSGNNYLVDSLIFFKIKVGARIRSIKTNLETHNYFGCLELAFEGYLSDGNHEYTYYIAESARRLIYLKTFNKNSQMFLGIYKNMFSYDFINRIQKFIYLIPCNDSITNKLSKERIYTPEKFFNYFAKVALENGNGEILLTKGLYNYTQNKRKKNTYLAQYITENGKYKPFVEELLSPSNQKTAKGLFIFDKVNAFNCEGKKPINLYFLEKEFSDKFDSISSNLYREKCLIENKKHISTQNLLNLNLKDALFFKNLSNLISTLISHKPDPYIVSPELGNYIVVNEYSSFQYVEVVYQVCVNAGLSALAAVYGVSTTPTQNVTRCFIYNKKRNTCDRHNYIKMGALNTSSFKNSLKKNIIKKYNYK